MYSGHREKESLFIIPESFNPVMTKHHVTRRGFPDSSPHSGGHGEKVPLEDRVLGCPSCLPMTCLQEAPMAP